MTELVGETATGKTQCCIYATYKVASNPNHTVCYIGTSNSFSVSRLSEMASNQESIEDILSRVQIVDTYDLFSLFDLLEEIREGLEQRSTPFYKNLKMIVIDSLASLIYPLLGQSTGHSWMITLARNIMRLAVQFGVIILSTNYVTGDAIRKPGLGESWTHIPSTQIMLSQRLDHHDRPMRFMTLLKSPRTPCNFEPLPFAITDKGIEDAS
eukprot:TRINITY_DN14031_c0_g1_i1.p1 TRINITY_DN14031_c0_g1~~TRINITY_DN14031_c0_g1_i1.p1  ORF type:complete len:221 (-),score=14.11 TRINITY_DN14031_c0_g1_i1:4-636(-)